MRKFLLGRDPHFYVLLPYASGKGILDCSLLFNLGIGMESTAHRCCLNCSMDGRTLIIVLLVVSASAVTYRPHVSLIMKNTTLRWNLKAKQEGPNVCAIETVWEGVSKAYDVAWTGGALCVPTSVKFECCEGWTRVPGERGCPQATSLLLAAPAAERVKADWLVRLMVTAGLEIYLNDDENPVTVFAPLNSASSSLRAHSRQLIEEGVARASRFEDAPPLLLSHVVRGRMSTPYLRNDQQLPTLTGQNPIRINVYPNGLITANCVPLVRRDEASLGPLIHTVASILPQGYVYSIADTVLREFLARKFASYLVQSRIDSLLRSSGPFTLFLPTDAAVDALGVHHAHALRYDEAAIQALVHNHIVNGVQCSVMLNDALLSTHQSETAKSRCRRTGTFVQGAMIMAADKMATNGVVHLVDRVLLPRRAMLLLDLLRTLGLTSLVSLVERGGLVSSFVSPDAFSLFAPNNLALEGSQRLNETEARSFVLNHMTSGRVFVSSLKTLKEIPSKGTRAPFTTRIIRDKVLMDAALVVSSDVEGLNGVVHVVDRVLVPPEQKTILQWLRDDGHYTEFIYTLRMLAPALYSRLDSSLKNVRLTVFAVADTYMGNKYHLYYDNRVLWNHILDYALVSEMIPASGLMLTPTMNEGELLLARRGAAIFAGSTHIIQPDILCSNGVIHLARDVIIDPRHY